MLFDPTRFRRIGVDPIRNIEWEQPDPSITVVNAFFSSHVLLKATGSEKCRAVTVIAMLYSVDRLDAIVAEIQSVLADDGVWFPEIEKSGTDLG